MREILDIEEEMRLHEASVDEIYQKMMTDVPIVSPTFRKIWDYKAQQLGKRYRNVWERRQDQNERV